MFASTIVSAELRALEDSAKNLSRLVSSLTNLDDYLPFPTSSPLNTQEQARFRNDPRTSEGSSLLFLHAERISRIQEELRIAKEALYQRQREVHNCLAPISILPNEILCMVFALLRASPSHIVAITHSCQRWRQTAVAHNLLWDHIHLDWPLPRIERWAQRSGLLPLNLYLQSVAVQSPGEILKNSPDLFIINRVPLFKRATSFSLSAYGRYLHRSDILVRLLHPISSTTLRFLVLTCIPHDIKCIIPCNVLPFTLHSLHLTRIEISDPDFTDFTYLRVLKICDISYPMSTWSTIFQTLHHVEELHFASVRQQDDHTGKYFPPITIASVRVLDVSLMDASLWGLILTSLHTPNILRLNLSYRYGRVDSRAERWISGLQSLRHLTIQSHDDPRFLSSQDFDISPALRALSSGFKSLRELRISTDDPFSMEEIKAFVLRRSSSLDNTPLQRLQLSHCSIEDASWLGQYVEDFRLTRELDDEEVFGNS